MAETETRFGYILLVATIRSFDLDWPSVSDKQRAENAEARRILESEGSD
jgi:hypothetical protein